MPPRTCLRSLFAATPHCHGALAGALLLAAAVVALPAEPPTGSTADYRVVFNQERFVIEPGTSYAVQALIAAVPAAGLFSYGVRLRFDPALARVDGASAIAVLR